MYRSDRPNAPLVIAAFYSKVFALEVATGTIAWSYEPPAEEVLSGYSPVRLYVDAHRVIGLCESLFCLDYLTGKERWRVDTRQFARGTMVVTGDVIVIARRGYARAVSAIEGTTIWLEDFPGKGTGETSLAIPGQGMQADLEGG